VNSTVIQPGSSRARKAAVGLLALATSLTLISVAVPAAAQVDTTHSQLVSLSATAGGSCVSGAEFRAVERGLRIRSVQHIFGTIGRVSNRDGSQLVKSYVKCGGTQMGGPWAVITYEDRRLVRKVWEVIGAD
jgi:hypothetical protein